MANYMKKVRNKKLKFYSILKSALKSIMNNKLRSSLTMLGLVIGIASVIILVGIGDGANQNVTNEVKSLGTDIITVSVNSSDTSFEYDNLNELKEVGNISTIAPYKTLNETIAKNTTSNSTIMAVDNNYLSVTNTNIQEGRTISVIDIENKSKVCILGSEIATTLFNLSDPIGQTIKIDGDNYTVIGLLETKGSSMEETIVSLLMHKELLM